MKTSGNTILITGGGTGIGAGLAKAFHDRGNRVIVAGRTAASLQSTVAGNEGMAAIELDVTSDDSVARAAELLARDYPDLNVVIHSAGIMSRDELTGGGLDLMRQVIDTNLIGTIRLVEALVPQLSGKPGATICTVTSGLAFAPLPSAPAYSASKAAVHSYTLSLRHRLKGLVDVVEIAPPAVRTGLTPGQESREGYMPLEDYIAETMANFDADPALRENLVRNVLPLRHAEREGRMDPMLDMLGNL